MAVDPVSVLSGRNSDAVPVTGTIVSELRMRESRICSAELDRSSDSEGVEQIEFSSHIASLEG